MDARSLAVIGLGALALIVGATLVGVSPEIWIPLIVIVGVLGIGMAIYQARAAGTDIAERVAARSNGTSVTKAASTQVTSAATATTSTRSVSAEKPVDVELVREATGEAPAVWLHRCGGRRVHRFDSQDGWMVQQVSTKDPDNPRKRVIGETYTFTTESGAASAADELARGHTPRTEGAIRLDPSGATA